MGIKIEGTRINLRPVKKSDAESICQYAKDEEISRFTFIPHPYTLKDAQDFIKLTQSARRKQSQYHFGMEDKESGRIIGMIGLNEVNHYHQRAELGYWLGRPFWGQEITAEAIRLMLRFCFGDLNLNRVTAFVFPDNNASRRVLEKVGFKCEGLLRQHLKQNNRMRDSYLYSILKEEWQAL